MLNKKTEVEENDVVDDDDAVENDENGGCYGDKIYEEQQQLDSDV